MIEGWGLAAAAVVAGGAVVGSAINASAAKTAAGEQVNAENASISEQENMFNQVQGNEQPFIQGGSQAQGQLNYLLGEGTPGTGGTAASSTGGAFGSLNAPFTTADFKSLSPQYQFNLQQGGQGVLNQNSSGQGSESPAALSALESYNQNFANNSFNSAFQNYQTQQNNVFSRLSGLATLGSNAGSNSATGASTFGQSIGNTTSSIGASQAAGTVGAANAISGGIQTGANAFYGQNALNQILNSGSTTSYNPYSTAGPAITGGTPANMAANSGDTYINTPSDLYLKKNIEPYLFYGTIPIYKFHYRDEDDSSKKHFGVIAQEVLKQRPDTVKRHKDGYLTVNYRKLGVPTDAEWQALENAGL